MPIGQRPLGDAPTMATDLASRRFSTGLRVNGGVVMMVPSKSSCFSYVIEAEGLQGKKQLSVGSSQLPEKPQVQDANLTTENWPLATILAGRHASDGRAIQRRLPGR